MKSFISVLIRNEEQLQIVKKYPVSMIYTDNLDLIQKDSSLYYMTPRVYKDLENLPQNILINDVGLLDKKRNIVIDYYMNVANTETIKLFMHYNVQKICLSVELSFADLKFISDLKKYPVEICLYGRVESMLLKKHPIFKKNGYDIENRNMEKYPIRVDESGQVHIFHFKPLNRIVKLNEYKRLGIYNFRIDFLEEEKNEINAILEKVFYLNNL